MVDGCLGLCEHPVRPLLLPLLLDRYLGVDKCPHIHHEYPKGDMGLYVDIYQMGAYRASCLHLRTNSPSQGISLTPVTFDVCFGVDLVLSGAPL